MAYKGRQNRGRSSFYEKKPNLSVPDFPQPPVEDTERTVPQAQGLTAETAYSKVRTYDAVLNKINVNYVGAAPIFGPQNPVQTYNLPGEYGLFTGSINNLYFHDQFKLLATLNRHILPNYHGIAFTPLWKWEQGKGSNLDTNLVNEKKLNKAVYAYSRNMSTLLSQITASQLTDLNFTHWHFDNRGAIKMILNQQTGKYEEDPNKAPADITFSGYDQILGSAQAHMLISYQLNLVSLMLVLLNFEYLVSQLPKLQELYKSRTNWFVYVQNQLKRSRFTAPVRQLLSWLKQRYVDTYFMKEVILPLSVVSKETDGLNSPILYFTISLDVPLQPVYFHFPGTAVPATDTSTTIMNGIQSSDLNVIRDTQGRISMILDNTPNQDAIVGSIKDDGSITDSSNPSYIWRRDHDAFQIHNVMDIVLNTDNSEDDVKTQLNDWMRTGLELLETLVAETVDMSNSAWLIDIETALTRLSENNSLNWKQNVDFTSLPPVIKYAQYKLIDDLMLFGGAPIVGDSIATAITQDLTNGYQMALPMYRKQGLPPTLMKEYAQAFYMRSDGQFISFVRLGSQLRVRFRGSMQHVHKCRWTTGLMPGAPAGVRMPILELPWNPFEEQFDTSYSSIHQLDIPAIQFKPVNPGDTPVVRLSPNWMATVVANFQNKSDEIMITLAKNFITPMA